MIQKLRNAISIQTKVHIKKSTGKDSLKQVKHFFYIIKLISLSDVEEKVTSNNKSLMMRVILGKEKFSFSSSVRADVAAVHHVLGFTL